MSQNYNYMAQSADQNIGKSKPVLAESTERIAKEYEKEEILEQAEPLVEGAMETVAGAEIEGFIEGKVSEKLKEGKKKFPSGTGATTGDDSSAATAVAQVALPNVDVMRIQISTKISKEIADLKKEAKRLRRSPAKFAPFQFSKVIARIRKLKDLLDSLFNATEETITNLWQKFVKTSVS
jgi:hypothetical protein